MIRPGQCQCGDVAYEVTGDIEPAALCHCSQCRRWSGHLWAFCAAPAAQVRLVEQLGLRWFQSSASARRGYCAGCGSSLFWQSNPDRICFSAGSLNGATGTRVTRDIFTGDAGDYYALPPGTEKPGSAAACEILQGGCLCGGVRFTMPGPVGAITACHCSQCRRLSGHFAASFDLVEALLHLTRRETLAVYRTDGGSERGFCSGCGSSLWFRAKDGGFSVEAGTIDGATGGQMNCHIHVAGKGDYYDLNDGLPQVFGGTD